MSPRRGGCSRWCCSPMHAGRRESTRDGLLVPLEDQDRSLWDREKIEEGTAILDAALPFRRAGPYQIQAAVAALHAAAPSPDRTDWHQIAALYGALLRHTPTPVVELERRRRTRDGGRA